MLVSMRCEQCGFDNDSRNRFCGMCGAKLPALPSEAPVTQPPPVRREPPVSGPSFLGLADEPASNVTYLLEDDLSRSHWGRSLFLLIILAAIGTLGWYKRAELQTWVGSLANRTTTQTAQTNSAPQPVAAPSSEATPSLPSDTPTPMVRPYPGVGDQPQQEQTPSAAAPKASSQPNAPAENNSQASAVQASAQKQSASAEPTKAALKEDQKGDGGAASAGTPASKSAAALKNSKADAGQTAASAAGDRLEVEGERYLYGSGVPANCARAQRDLLAAAEDSNAKAQSVLGTMYATGHCTPRDLPLAYRWFARALSQDPGNSRLQQDLRVLWNQMGPDERQLALRAER